MTDSADRISVLKARYEEAGQGHVFRFLKELADGERKSFLDQLEALDLSLVRRLRDTLANPPSFKPEGELTPPPYVPLSDSSRETVAGRAAIAYGEKALSDGQVAVITVAGGQGTRLGFDKPKGMYPIGPVTNRTLFQMHADTVRALSERYGAPVPWAIMLSDATDAGTRAYFEENDYLGLDAEDVLFFKQSTLPALDTDGKLILCDKGRLFRSPNGHGGTLYALLDCGVLEALETRGVRHAFYFQVDNPAVLVADPAFMGHHIAVDSEMSLKVARRRDPEEKVGVLVQTEDQRLHVIEYSDLDEVTMYGTDDTGELLYPMGSPAIHIFDLSFIRRVAGGDETPPLHIAHKKIPYVASDGKTISPEEPSGYKFETFIFDALPLARNALLVEMDRAEEFAPVKNAEGDDSPDTCRQIMSDKYARWLAAAGVNVPTDGKGQSLHMIEIMPYTALSSDGLQERKSDLPGRIDGDICLDARDGG